MKRLLLFSLLYALLSVAALRADDCITIDGVLYMIPASNPETVSVMGCDDLPEGADKTVRIRSSVTIDGVDYPVKSIGRRAFQNCNLTEVVIPSSIVSISQEAFSNSAIESIKIPEEVTFIGPSAFSSCRNLKHIEGGSYSKAADRMCEASALESIVLPATLTEIGDFAFKGTPLKSIVIPEKTTTIGSEAFANCHQLANVEIKSAKLIGTAPNSFMGCTALKRIKAPKTIGNLSSLIGQ